MRAYTRASSILYTLVILSLVSVECHHNHDPHNLRTTYQVNANATEVFQVIEGILKGMEVKGADLEQMMACIKKVEDKLPDIIQVINDAMANLTHIDFAHIPQIINAVTQIINVVKETLDKAKNCSAGIPEMEKIYALFNNLNLTQISENVTIMLINGDLLNKIHDANQSFKNGLYVKEGEDYG